MTAPERVGEVPTRARPSTPPRERVTEPAPKRTRGTGGTPRTRSPAAGRPQPRRAARPDGWKRLVPRRASAIAPKAPFVILVMAVLATGLAAILWLSTQAATDSYRLETARKQTTDLSYQAEQLRRQVAEMDSAPSLVQRAQELGLVPVGDPARLVVRPDGSVTVFGTPSPAKAPPPPPPPPPPVTPAGPTPSQQAAPGTSAGPNPQAPNSTQAPNTAPTTAQQPGVTAGGGG
jgi:hypothetical protein